MTTETKPTKITYPSWFIKTLAKAVEAAEAMDKALADTNEPNVYVDALALKYEDETIGTLLWLDDQWQFEPDTAYWGLKT